VYQPSIYSYNCRGAFFLSSEERGSEGRCRGLKSRLQLLADLDPSTREDAIKSFTYMTDYELDEDDSDPASSSLNQKTKSILVSPALIYKEDGTAAATSSAGASAGKDAGSRNSDAKSPIPTTPSSTLPEEELIKRQTWNCYGSTEAEYLVLKNRDTGHEHIAAVAPRNFGVSVRKIEANEGSSITSIGVGWLNIVVDAGPTFVEESEVDGAKAADDQQRIQSQQQSRQQPQQEQEQQHDRPMMPEEVPPRPDSTTLRRAKDSVGKFVDFSGKVAVQMQSNVNWLYHNLQDDFPSRTYAAGQRISNQIPKTVDRTASFMGKMLGRWTGEGGDDDEDGGGGSQGGR